MSEVIRRSVSEKFYECDRHEEKIRIAKKYLSSRMPLSLEEYRHLDDVGASFIDQLIFRFSKLQDTLGEKIFPAILQLSGEEVKRKTFIDILNRLEELGVVNKVRWMQLRESRNQVAHEYSFNIDQLLDSINVIFTATDELLTVYNSVKSFVSSRFSLPALDKS